MDHLKHLELLRDHLRNERRKLARKMATAQNMPRSFTKLLELQQEFDAVKRAIDDEKYEAKPTIGAKQNPRERGDDR
jgi:hypothetical protein